MECYKNLHMNYNITLSKKQAWISIAILLSNHQNKPFNNDWIEIPQIRENSGLSFEVTISNVSIGLE